MCYWPSVRELRPNHVVLMFQPQIVTILKPRLCCLLLHRLFFEYTTACPPDVRCPSGGGSPLLTWLPIYQLTPYCRTTSSTNLGITRLCPIIPITPRPPLARRFQSLTTPPLPRPCHAYRIPITEILGDSYYKVIPLPKIPNNRASGRDSPLPWTARSASVTFSQHTFNCPQRPHDTVTTRLTPHLLNP